MAQTYSHVAKLGNTGANVSEANVSGNVFPHFARALVIRTKTRRFCLYLKDSQTIFASWHDIDGEEFIIYTLVWHYITGYQQGLYSLEGYICDLIRLKLLDRPHKSDL